jgi:type I restriction-modification system DNA methylase subunit
MQTLSKTEKVKKFGEVFTPEKTVREMCDMLEAENDDRDVFAPETTFLEPACGDGAFVAEILRRKFDRCKRRRDYTVALESVYGFEIQADNVERCIQNLTILCCQYFKLTKAEEQIICDHIIQCDGLKVMRMLAAFDH